MSCKYEYNGLCTIMDIDCGHPEENNPELYNEETGFPCICGFFESF